MIERASFRQVLSLTWEAECNMHDLSGISQMRKRGAKEKVIDSSQLLQRELRSAVASSHERSRHGTVPTVSNGGTSGVKGTSACNAGREPSAASSS